MSRPCISGLISKILRKIEEKVTSGHLRLTALVSRGNKLLHVLKYVDDNVIHEALCFDNHVIGEDGRKVSRASLAQNLFRQITRVAESMGMRVNTNNTFMLCISDPQTNDAAAFLEDGEGSRIELGDSMKILGINFSISPNVSAQVEAIFRKFRSRVWT